MSSNAPAFTLSEPRNIKGPLRESVLGATGSQPGQRVTFVSGSRSPRVVTPA